MTAWERCLSWSRAAIVDDETFESLRAALAPERDVTARCGALHVLASLIDDDPRLLSLLATLLRDREEDVASQAAALAYSKPEPAEKLERDLRSQWQRRPSQYHENILHLLGDQALRSLAQDFAEHSVASVRESLLTRLAPPCEAPELLAALLFLTHDLDAGIRARALVHLAGTRTSGARAALLRLTRDADEDVRAIAATNLHQVCDLAECEGELTRMLGDSSPRVVQHAQQALGHLKAARARDEVATLVERMEALIREGEFRRAQGLASQILLKVDSHPRVQVLLAKASLGLGEPARARRILQASLESGALHQADLEHEQDLRDLLAE